MCALKHELLVTSLLAIAGCSRTETVVLTVEDPLGLAGGAESIRIGAAPGGEERALGGRAFPVTLALTSEPKRGPVVIEAIVAGEVRARGVAPVLFTKEAIGFVTIPLGPPCTGGPDCDDGRFCNGEERCIEGVCRGGTPECENRNLTCIEVTCLEETRSCAVRSVDGLHDLDPCTLDLCAEGEHFRREDVARAFTPCMIETSTVDRICRTGVCTPSYCGDDIVDLRSESCEEGDLGCDSCQGSHVLLAPGSRPIFDRASDRFLLAQADGHVFVTGDYHRRIVFRFDRFTRTATPIAPVDRPSMREFLRDTVFGLGGTKVLFSRELTANNMVETNLILYDLATGRADDLGGGQAKLAPDADFLVLWNYQTLELISLVPGLAGRTLRMIGSVRDFDCSRHAERIAIATNDFVGGPALLLAEASSGEPREILSRSDFAGRFPGQVAISTDGSAIGLITCDSTNACQLMLVDPDTRETSIIARTVYAFDLSADGRTFVYRAPTGLFRFDRQTGETTAHASDTAPQGDVSLALDGRTVATAVATEGIYLSLF